MVDRYPGHIITHLTLTDRYFKSSGSSVLIYYAHSSLLCTSTAHIYRVSALLLLPQADYLHLPSETHSTGILYLRKLIQLPMLLDYNRHGDILKDLPVNYRPPSALGIAIPLSHNIYNADPSKPLLYSKYKKSMETAVFKLTPSCYQKSSPCGCTPDKEASRLVTHSDCIKRVYKLTLPGWLYLCFAFEVLNTTSNRIYLSPIDSMYNLTLKELNGRKDFQLYRQESARSKADTISQKSADLEGFAYSTAPII
ncbi:CATSPERB [Bugula neritina]|uniref:CATSPERB n=1 Tax=Bugula neritina TaxID=10212 RepID=A0A7J7KC18_BUGNE|nr:CATSPERB [Bugula neritina]